jgi:predicted nuclease with TOPRIM domain
MALNERLSESEADRAARLDAIERLEKERLALNERLTESDADRAARLEVINALEKERLALDTRLAALHCEIEGLQQWTNHENVQDDAAARRVLQIAQRILGSPVVKLWSRLSAPSRRIG